MYIQMFKVILQADIVFSKNPYIITFTKEIQLPFVPLKNMCIQDKNAEYTLDKVIWKMEEGFFQAYVQVYSPGLVDFIGFRARDEINTEYIDCFRRKGFVEVIKDAK